MPVCTNFNDGGALREKLWCDDLFYTSDRMNWLDHFVVWSARLEDILIAGIKTDYFPYTICLAFASDYRALWCKHERKHLSKNTHFRKIAETAEVMTDGDEVVGLSD